MLEICNEYLDNIKRSKRLAKFSVNQACSEDELLDIINRNAKEQYSIKTRNIEILSLSELGLNLNVTELTKAQIDNLQEFSEYLLQNFVSVDTGLLLSVNKLLLQYYRYKNNRDMIIYESYYCGVASFIYNRLPKDHYEKLDDNVAANYFKEAAKYIDTIDSISSKKIRLAIIKACIYVAASMTFSENIMPSDLLINMRKNTIFLMNEFKNEIKILDKFKNSNAIPADDLDIAMFRLKENATILLSDLRITNNSDISSFVYECVCYINDHKNDDYITNMKENIDAKHEYTYHAAKFHNKLISINSLLRFLYNKIISTSLDDFSVNGTYINLYYAYYLVIYYKQYCHNKNRWYNKVKYISKRADKYIINMPKNDTSTLISSYINFSTAIHSRYSSESLNDYLLNILLSFHHQTYVHSLMVGELTKIICNELIIKNPYAFIGFNSYKNIEEVLKNKSKILNFAYYCGLYHDIGKSSIINIINVYWRNLTNIEFDAIKLHPYAGFSFLSYFDNTKKYCYAALGHHKWYNNKGGYPDIFNRESCDILPIIDILAIADSLDAGTDNIGRGYAIGKSFIDIVNEFKNLSGQRYAPYVVELFKDKKFYTTMEKQLYKKRQKAYIYAYHKTNNEAI